jgi:hypothetical protein
MTGHFEGQVVTRWERSDDEAGSTLARLATAALAGAMPWAVHFAVALLAGEQCTATTTAASVSMFAAALAAMFPTSDRDMVLLEDFTYITGAGERITTPAGTTINGASVPWYLRRLFEPFIGRYRRATVIHDGECKRRDRPSSQVHARFYEMAIADGCPKWQAAAMWAGVRFGGPRFEAQED